jgi:hypothetical protein
MFFSISLNILFNQNTLLYEKLENNQNNIDDDEKLDIFINK